MLFLLYILNFYFIFFNLLHLFKHKIITLLFYFIAILILLILHNIFGILNYKSTFYLILYNVIIIIILNYFSILLRLLISVYYIACYYVQLWILYMDNIMQYYIRQAGLILRGLWPQMLFASVACWYLIKR